MFDELFGSDGCGFEYVRLSIGANDFAESRYSYNETEGDYEMKSFSIDCDRKYSLPAIKEAQKRSPEISFFASPWSPPTWMKFPKAYNYGRLIQTEENLKAYALYFKKYLLPYPPLYRTRHTCERLLEYGARKRRREHLGLETELAHKRQGRRIHL
ncbi:MAG: hypothetical protein IKK70_00670 [Clostridia bacterium]|nr:hypothetical protein [Clostridia bacterium]